MHRPALLALLLALAGCGDATGQTLAPRPIPNQDRVVVTSPAGVAVGFPARLVEHEPGTVQACLQLVDAAGLPPGWRVQVHQAGWFPVDRGVSPTGFASGLTRVTTRELHLALAQGSGLGLPFLPALGHEVGHVNAYLAGDPNWAQVGH